MSELLKNDPSGRAGRRDRQSGFTLIELMVVVTIIAILAAIGLPQLTKFVRKAETTDPTTVLGTLDQAIRGYLSSRAGTGTDITNLTGAAEGASVTADTALEAVLAGYWSRPSDTKFTYKVLTLTVDATTKVATFCLRAASTDLSGSGTAGQFIYWRSPAPTVDAEKVGFDGKANIVGYVTGTNPAVPTGCS